MLARLDIAENHAEIAAETLRKVSTYFESNKDKAAQIEIRTVLIEALLAVPSGGSKRELGLLARVEPDTQNVSLRLAANLQIARARSALGDKKHALELLTEVISEAQRLGYESQLLEARLAEAEIALRSGDSSAASVQMEEIAKQADARGLKLIANKARSSLKREAS